MAYAEFNDKTGRSWRVWHTLPRLAEVLSALPPAWKQGWLTFESDTEKRRLAPFPANWETLPPARLELLCRMAQPATQPAATQALLHREERDTPSRPPQPPR